MFYWLLYPIKDIDSELSFFRIFAYVSFRSVLAAFTSLVLTYFLGDRFVQWCKKINFREQIRSDGPQTHQQKKNTPTMGGLLILNSMLISTLLWGNFSNRYLWITLLGTLSLGALGFYDDYCKSVKKITNGISVKTKFFVQSIIGLVFAYAVFSFPYVPTNDPNLFSALFVPFMKYPIIYLNYLAIPFWVILINATSNSVNLTDGLDGLAVGISSIVLATLGIIAYLTGIFAVTEYLLIPFVPEVNELCIFIAALLGATVGFLWYNSYPANIFMGDTGSLGIGGAIGMIAICIKRELLLLILGGIFVVEALSVILQVGYYKARKKRIFLMAPLHHHFELKGWHENKIVIRFWIIGTLLALISLSSLKII